MAGVEDPGAVQRELRQVEQEQRQRDEQHERLPAEDRQGARRVPAEASGTPPALGRQGLRQHQQPVEPVGHGDHRRGVERPADVVMAEQPTEQRAQHEAESERRTDDAETGRALLRWRDIGDVSTGGGHRCTGQAVQHAGDEQPADARHQRHRHVVEAGAEHRHQQHRPPTEPVRQGAEHRREQEQHDRVGGPQVTDDLRRITFGTTLQFPDQMRPHRNQEPEAERVQQQGHEDEGESGAAGRHAALVVGPHSFERKPQPTSRVSRHARRPATRCRHAGGSIAWPAA